MTVALPKSTRRKINCSVFATGINRYLRRGTARIAAPKRQKRQQIRKARRALAHKQRRRFV